MISILYAILGFSVLFTARTAILSSVDSTLNGMSSGFLKSYERPPPLPPPRGPEDHQPDTFRFDPDHHPPDFGHGEEKGSPESPDARPEPPVQPADIHETKTTLVWREPGARLPFPVSRPTDVVAAANARRGEHTLRTITFEGQPVKVVTVPVKSWRDGHIIAVLQINYWLGDIYKTLGSLTETLFLILPFGILVMAGASRFVVGKTLKPIREMTATAAKIEAENLTGRLHAVGNDEFADLAETMNGMLGRLDTAFASQRKTLEQLREIILQQQRFTADASHELKTPLSVVKVNASLLKTYLDEDPDVLESVDAIDQAVNRMSKLVQDLLLLARTDAGQLDDQFGEVDLISTADGAACMATCKSRIKIKAPSEAICVRGSQFALERLFSNLLDNACRHSEGQVDLILSKRGQVAVIEVCDTGEGIPPDHLPFIFQRFHRVDGSRHSGTGGAGLGLAICKGIVEAHAGTIRVESTVEVGTRFTVELPIP